MSEELWDKANEVYKSKRNLRNINNLNKQEYLDNSKYTSKIICKEHNKYFTRCGSCKRRNNSVWACRECIVGDVVKCESPFIREIELDKLMTFLIEEKLSNENEKIINNLLQNYLIVLNKNNNEEFNLIIVEDEMKAITGINLLQQLNQINKFKVPVVILLDKNKETIKEHYINDGFSDYILKTNITNELERIIKKFI